MSDHQPTVTTAWLIERGQSMGQVPTAWYADEHNVLGHTWTTDAWRARRFATREECEAFIDERSGFPIPSHGSHLGPLGHRFGVAVEHGFIGPYPHA